MKSIPLYLLIAAAGILLIGYGCGGPCGPVPADFPDLLKAESSPETCGGEWPLSLFYDQGAWFGFGLPGASQQRGQFSGPFCHFSGTWAGSSLFGLRIRNSDTGQLFDFVQSEFSAVYYPGRLVQHALFPDLEVTLTLIFISGRTALATADLISLSGHHLTLDIHWYGSADKPLTAEGNSVLLTPPLPGGEARITVSGISHPRISPDGLSYTLLADSGLHVSTAGRAESAAVFTITYPGDDRRQERITAQQALANPHERIAANTSRWTSYLANAGNDSAGTVYAKSVMTLIGNWKHARGDLRHDGLLPSAAVSYFNGFWGWDSWKHAAALTSFAPALAMDQVRAMFDYQNRDGMIADCIYADKRQNNWRNSKPPLAAWAVRRIYEETADTTFVREMLPGLERYHTWWYAHRDHDRNGLCEYGSADGTLTAARWESGMDDGLRFDNTRMLKNSGGSWSMDQESVDLNCYLYADKLELAALCRALGADDAADRYIAAAEKLAGKIRNSMFDPESGFFYDRRIGNRELVKIMGPEGWIPLWTGVADSTRAAAVREVMLDPDRFSTFVPLPTVPADHEAFMTGYWRGPVWIDQTWFGIEGLKSYGYRQDAALLTKRLLNNAEGVTVPGVSLRENYDPRDGSGLNVHHFSWTAAHLLMLTGR